MQSLQSRLRGQWGARASTLGVLAGYVVTLAGLFVGLAVGGPFLGHPGRPMWALAGAAAFGVGALWVSKGWRHSARRTRALATVLALLIGASFTVGTVTNPVVVDGKVFLSSSTEARSYRLLQDLRRDLLRLSEVDQYLLFTPAQAGAHFSEYTSVRDELLAMSQKYTLLADNTDDLPAEEFLPVVQQATAASFWAAKAIEAKVAVLEAPDVRAEQDLAAQRSSYAEALLLSGQMLRELSTVLDLPLSQMGPSE